jgi:hypothetical protein
MADNSVYFIFQKGDNHRCKIGKTKNLKQRKTQLQTGNPKELYVYKKLDGYTELENELHERFEHKRIRKTEWYHMTKDEVDLVVENYYFREEQRKLLIDLTESKNRIFSLNEKRNDLWNISHNQGRLVDNIKPDLVEEFSV